jgi:hypothetical protein
LFLFFFYILNRGHLPLRSIAQRSLNFTTSGSELVAHSIEELSDTIAFTFLETIEDVDGAEEAEDLSGVEVVGGATAAASGAENEGVSAAAAAVRTPVRERRADTASSGRSGENLVVVPDEATVVLDTAAAAADGNVDENARGIDIQEGATDEIVRSAVALTTVVTFEGVTVERRGSEGGGGPELGSSSLIIEI